MNAIKMVNIRVLTAPFMNGNKVSGPNANIRTAGLSSDFHPHVHGGERSSRNSRPTWSGEVYEAKLAKEHALLS